MDRIFELRLVVDADECPYSVYSIHHRLTDMRVRLFFDCSEAARVMAKLTYQGWNRVPRLSDKVVLLAQLDRACEEEHLGRRQIVSEVTGEFIAWVWGSADVSAAVAAAERANL
jgi:hypothetical protein